eukprot:11001749-Alexandrium_andersonii.AAC.1
MSASLVGSEMCIRDSTAEQEEPSTYRHRDAETQRRRDTETQRHIDRHRPCLLYTSDAADDM